MNRKRVTSSLSTGIRKRIHDAGLTCSGLSPAKDRYREVLEGNAGELAARYQQSILLHAQSQVPYYQHLGLAADSLEAFPVLSKAVLREYWGQLRSRGLRSSGVANIRSGGTTGEPVTVLMDRNALQWDYASWIYYHEQILGIREDTYLSRRKVCFSSPRSRVPGRAHHLLLRLGRLVSQTTYLSPGLMSRQTLDEYASRINKLRPAYIEGFSVPLYTLAYHARREGIRMHHPLAIFTTGSTLFPTVRSCIEDVFGCQVYDSYGSRETGDIAGECSHKKLHLFSFNNTVEVVDPDGLPVAEDQMGRVLVTSLHNYAMPLIRYEIGDLASVGSGACECGSSLPFLNRIEGRILEHFPTRDGGLIGGGYFFKLFSGSSWISEFHVLQVDLDRVVIFYTCQPGEHRQDEDLARIAIGIRRAMGQECVVEWREVDTIPRTRYGKRLFTRSLVWEDRNSELAKDMFGDPVPTVVESPRLQS